MLVTLDNVATINAALYSNLTYDPSRDLAPVTMLVMSPLVMVVNPSLPARSVKDLLKLARARPGELKFAEDMSERETIKDELVNFQRHVTAAGRATFEARGSKHDDIVIAVEIGRAHV